eukprot:749015-Hanusia_phi.AAC.9
MGGAGNQRPACVLSAPAPGEMGRGGEGRGGEEGGKKRKSTKGGGSNGGTDRTQGWIGRIEGGQTTCRRSGSWEEAVEDELHRASDLTERERRVRSTRRKWEQWSIPHGSAGIILCSCQTSLRRLRRLCSVTGGGEERQQLRDKEDRKDGRGSEGRP